MHEAEGVAEGLDVSGVVPRAVGLWLHRDATFLRGARCGRANAASPRGIRRTGWRHDAGRWHASLGWRPGRLGWRHGPAALGIGRNTHARSGRVRALDGGGSSREGLGV